MLFLGGALTKHDPAFLISIAVAAKAAVVVRSLAEASPGVSPGRRVADLRVIGTIGILHTQLYHLVAEDDMIYLRANRIECGVEYRLSIADKLFF